MSTRTRRRVARPGLASRWWPGGLRCRNSPGGRAASAAWRTCSRTISSTTCRPHSRSSPIWAGDEQPGGVCMSDQSASALLRAGRLADATGAAQAALRKAPMDLGARLLLAELLVLSGNLERADVILDATSAV